MIEEIISLVIPFIAIALLAVIIDRIILWLSSILNAIPIFPDKVEWYIAFTIVFIISYLVCWQGNFDFMSFLGFQFNYAWEGYLVSAAIISGGSSMIKNSFNLINEMPSVITGLTTTFKRKTVTTLKKTEENNSIEEQNIITDIDAERYSDEI